MLCTIDVAHIAVYICTVRTYNRNNKLLPERINVPSEIVNKIFPITSRCLNNFFLFFAYFLFYSLYFSYVYCLLRIDIDFPSNVQDFYDFGLYHDFIRDLL